METNFARGGREPLAEEVEVRVVVPQELAEEELARLVAAYEGLIEAVGWTGRSALGAALARSLLIAVACLDGRVVGAARVVGDGIYTAVLYDLVVSPDAHGEGIGQALVDAIRGQIRAPRLECIADPEAVGFYESTGWQRVDGFAIPRLEAPRTEG